MVSGHISLYTHKSVCVHISLCTHRFVYPHISLHTQTRGDGDCPFLFTGWRRLIGSPELQRKGQSPSPLVYPHISLHTQICVYTHRWCLHTQILYTHRFVSKERGDGDCPFLFTGWRRLIGSPELQIIFHKRAIQYRSLLRKMTYKERDPMSLRHIVRITALSLCFTFFFARHNLKRDHEKGEACVCVCVSACVCIRLSL